jgi:uncharacterized membrane protein HdeD (DUF308 family)
MQDALTERWWVVALRGGAAGIFGLSALLTPGLTLDLLESLFGLFALGDGALALLLGRPGARRPGSRLLLAEGAVGVAIGVLVLLWPSITVFVLVLLVALRAVATGALQLAESRTLRRAGQGDRLLDVVGALSVVVGLALLTLPSLAARGLLWWVALHAIVSAALLVALALRLRAAHDSSVGGGMIGAT